MKRKKLILFTFEREAKERYLADLKSFLGDYLDIEGYCLRDNVAGLIEADLAVISSPSATPFIKPHLADNVEIIYLARTFILETARKLLDLPAGTKAMLVDYSYDTCMDIISALHEIGMNHVDFTPVYPGMEAGNAADMDIAITPGLLSYVPPGVRQVIDIGWTVTDASTIMEIAIKLNVYNDRIEERLVGYSNRITPIHSGLIFALKSSGKLKNQWDTILNVIDDGVMMLDENNNILLGNKRLLKIFGLKETETYLLQPGHNESCRSVISRVSGSETLENILIKLPQTNKSVVVTKKPLVVHNHSYGSIVIVKDVTEIQSLESQLRKQLTDKGLVAKYKFEDIVGYSKPLQDCIARARKIARSDAAVLITGESGTGKELFAQSIHNASDRRKKPFVAINCAALPPSLLESELFGYEEGSFTNAKKGGKKGLFELAHTGTLFLDEIGDLPVGVQVKLLRVLQEREVMRIGATSILPVDVRVIAATNRHLRELAQKGEFRRDLYYRLNMLTLHLPALRERKEDIPRLAEDILAAVGCRHKKLDDNVLGLFERYPWDGNVRELKSYVEYMAYMGGDVLTEEDLPPDFQLGMDSHGPDNGEVFAGLLPREKTLAKAMLKVWRARNAGRRVLYELLAAQGIDTSEHELRRMMDVLAGLQIIEYGNGRAGARLTAKGRTIRL
ncbi:MAG TPA: sigma 54-interacting transcriptional regulator [Selenomonadales bacterium]|nr:sigma 54-interacting transcriptional regulator [Selenomonadales bacterium]